MADPRFSVTEIEKRETNIFEKMCPKDHEIKKNWTGGWGVGDAPYPSPKKKTKKNKKKQKNPRQLPPIGVSQT